MVLDFLDSLNPGYSNLNWEKPESTFATVWRSSVHNLAFLKWSFAIRNIIGKIQTACLARRVEEREFKAASVCPYNWLSSLFVITTYVCICKPKKPNVISNFSPCEQMTENDGNDKNYLQTSQARKFSRICLHHPYLKCDRSKQPESCQDEEDSWFLQGTLRAVSPELLGWASHLPHCSTVWFFLHCYIYILLLEYLNEKRWWSCQAWHGTSCFC